MMFICRSEKLIWKIIPILEAKKEMQRPNLSLITKTINNTTRILVPS